VEGRTCQELLHELLGRTYAADGAEYGLAVACYTLQHPARRSDTALEWAHVQLREAVAAGRPLGEARRAARARFDQRRFRPASAPPDPLRPVLAGAGWRMTIAGAAALPAGPDAARLLAWARAIAADIDERRAGSADRRAGVSERAGPSAEKGRQLP
jgi:hypothetical protein